MINLKTPDSQFIASTLNGVVRHPAPHLVEGRGPGDVHQLEPGRLGPVHAHHALHDPGLRPEQEPALLAGGQAADQLPRVRAGVLERRGSRARAERRRSTGRTTSSRTSTRRTSAKDPAHFHAFYATTAYPVSLVFDNNVYPYSLVAFRHALSMAIDRNTVSKLGEYGYAPRDRRDRAQRPLPAVGHRRLGEGAVEAALDVRPDGSEEAADRQRVHLQGQQALSTRRAIPSRSTST